MNGCYRELILNGKIPTIFHGAADWDILKWSLQDWSAILKNEILPFRCGEKRCQKSPLWEGSCEMKYHTIDEFIEFCCDEEAVKNEWRYFDYKHIAEFFRNKINLFGTVSWGNVGFPELGAESSTLWIGSPGAHTPCHIDTYGCNIVVQVYGKKRWLLFPRSETDNLQPTRVPYEESSIYSNINFSCFENFKNESFDNCYHVDLSPGDILFVPPKWWHYVENLSTAISINTWIPHKDDDHWRLEEALVRYFISSVVGNISENMAKIILNPNESDLEDCVSNLKTLNFCKIRSKEAMLTSDIPVETTDVFRNQCHKHAYELVPKISNLELRKTMMDASTCNLNQVGMNHQIVSSPQTDDLTSVINAFCHPDIIHEIRNKLSK